tara:strand:- start:59 stop:490 length:432 start_codon:yes stop_codon:yes gene_type:complete
MISTERIQDTLLYKYLYDTMLEKYNQDKDSEFINFGVREDWYYEHLQNVGNTMFENYFDLIDYYEDVSKKFEQDWKLLLYWLLYDVKVTDIDFIIALEHEHITKIYVNSEEHYCEESPVSIFDLFVYYISSDFHQNELEKKDN